VLFSEEIQRFVSNLFGDSLTQHVRPLQHLAISNFKLHFNDLHSQATNYLNLGDARSANFPLMNPFDMILITLSYLLIVLLGLVFLKIFPRFYLPMVKIPQFFYNVFLVMVSFWIGAEAIYQAFVINDFGFVGNPNSPNDPKLMGIARVMWAFYFSKIIEMLETVFMIIRNNPRQITFLHVFHHSTIFFIWWFVIYYGPGGDAIFSVIINSFIHVIMYSYYASATVGVSWGALKNLLTIVQMIQFVWMIVHSSVVLIIDDRSSHRFLVWTLIIYSFILLLLFLRFYRNPNQRPLPVSTPTTQAKSDKRKKE